MSASLAEQMIGTGAMRVRVLVADDEPLARQLVGNALRRDGFEVIEAADGDAALTQAARQQPDLALVDLEMGPTDGFRVVRELKAQSGAGIHVAVISGWADDASRLAAFDAGADDFVAKPAYVPELLRRVHAAARTQRAYVDARQSREQADRLMLYGQEAAALLAHDLNNGLSVALGNLAFLKVSPNLDADEADAARATLRALQRMAGLVSNFVDISRLEESAVVCRPERVDVAALLAEVVGIHAPALRNDGSRLEIDCPAGLTGTFDPALIERALHNLAGNAVRYVQPGGLVRVSAVPEILDGVVHLSLAVANTGPGIPPEAAARLFSKYGTGGNGKSQRGMGLYFCKLVSEAHGGAITYEPQDHGPRFVIRLPQ